MASLHVHDACHSTASSKGHRMLLGTLSSWSSSGACAAGLTETAPHHNTAQSQQASADYTCTLAAAVLYCIIHIAFPIT